MLPSHCVWRALNKAFKDRRRLRRLRDPQSIPAETLYVQRTRDLFYTLAEYDWFVRV